MATPRMEKPLAMRSAQLPGFTPPMMPTGMPIRTAIAIAARVSASVSGKRAAISSVIGRPVMKEVPRSPCSRRPT